MTALTDRHRAVLKLIGESNEWGLTASEITRATIEHPPDTRVWSAQQGGRVARELADKGYARVNQHRKKTYYTITGMGRGYLSVDEPAGGDS